MKNHDLDRCARILINSLQLKADYHAGSPGGSRALLVEGETDKVFISRVQQPDVLCCTVSDMIRDRAAFIPGAAGINRKNLILTLLLYLSHDPEFFGFPKGAENWPVYGLIDRDFEDEARHQHIRRLFMTDTHDLETLLLSTDSGLLSRIKTPKIPEAVRLRAFYLASQLAWFRQAVYEEGTLDTRNLNDGDGFVDYSAFVQDDRIVLEKLAGLLNKRRADPLPAGKLRQVTRKISAGMKKQLDAQGMWKKGFETFSGGRGEAFWFLTNGHDILSAVCYYEPGARIVFCGREGYKLNRDFEFALITLYDLHTFRGTELWKKMDDAGLLAGDCMG